MVLVNFLYLLPCLDLIKSLAAFKALEALVHVAEDEHADKIVMVTQDIVCASTNENAVALFGDIAHGLKLRRYDLHIKAEVFVQTVAACVEDKCGHALFIEGVNEVSAEVGVICSFVYDLLVVSLVVELFGEKSCDLPTAGSMLSADGNYHMPCPLFC